MGCGDPRAALQRRFTELFPQGVPDEEVSSSVIDALRADPWLACRTIG